MPIYLTGPRPPYQDVERFWNAVLQVIGGRQAKWIHPMVIEIDEPALIEFFGVAPQPQPDEERQFFAAPVFVKQVGGLELEVSISAHMRDLRATLRLSGSRASLMELVVPGVMAVGIDRGTSRPWLRVTSQSHGVVTIAVDPTITMVCDGSISA